MPREADFGNIFSDSLHLYFNNFLEFFIPYFVVSLALGIPATVAAQVYLGNFLAGFQPGNPLPPNFVANFEAFILVFIAIGVVGWVFGSIVNGAMTYFAVERHRGHPVDLGTALRQSLARFISIMGASLLAGLAVVGVFLLAFAVLIGGLVSRSPSLIGLGALALLASIPLMIFLGLSLCLYTPPIVMEKVGALGALSRSWNLTRGHRLSLFGVFFILFILSIVVSALVRALGASAGNVYVGAFASAVAQGFVGSWFVIVIAVAYDLIVRYASAFQYYGPGFGQPAQPYAPLYGGPAPPPGEGTRSP